MTAAYIPALRYDNRQPNRAAVEEKARHIWIPARIEWCEGIGEYDGINSKDEPYTSEGSVNYYYDTPYEKRFALGVALKEANPTTDELLQAKDWCYVQMNDPMEDPSINLENGDVWYNNTTYKVYKDHAWYTWGTSAHLRTPSLNGKTEAMLQYIMGDGVNMQMSTSDAARAILPCFSIKVN